MDLLSLSHDCDFLNITSLLLCRSVSFRKVTTQIVDNSILPVSKFSYLCSNQQVLVYESGAVEIHKISSVFANASGDELDRFASYLDSVL